MTDKSKKELDTLWIKYQKTLEMLDHALDELDRNPKEIEIPVTEYVEVPKIVEVEIVKDITQQTRDAYEKQIQDLKDQLNKPEPIPTPNSDYWGRPKASKKVVADQDYEQMNQRRYNRLVNEVKSGALDINTLTNAEQDIVRKKLNEK